MNTLTPFLGINKSNPLLEVLIDSNYPDVLLVHYGMLLLEKVQRGRDSIAEKLLAGRLYNAGFKRKALVQAFCFDLKTIQKFGDALKAGNCDILRDVLSGRGNTRKIKDREARFIWRTYLEVFEEMSCHAQRYVRNELEDKLGIKVCSEVIRLFIKKKRII